MIDWHARVRARLAQKPKTPDLKVIVDGKVVRPKQSASPAIPKKPKF